MGVGAGENGNNQCEWEGNGNKTRLNLGSGMGMGMNHWEWEEIGFKKTFPLISSLEYKTSEYEKVSVRSVWSKPFNFGVV